ncbi:non-specific lipid-transfer protein 1-like [Impatiens glandulifera]|uniref:non-specific lipid-transfer protein 1-like n=1 Tax=Impatiens glandulifera TaxID=253017 RepID=UPI001FB0B5A9|nr:non-specific lipid-transfer protein 1-like [Impatiens glandulifera]
MKVIKNVRIGCVLLVVICMVMSPTSQAAITCGTVTSYILPCVTYARNGGAIPQACCNGVRNFSTAGKTTADRRAACACLKQFAGAGASTFKYAAGIPAKCGVNIPYKIDPSTDCTKVA